MAFTLAEAQQIRTFLGYADTNVAANAWLYSSIGQLSTESEAAVRSILAELVGVDTQLATVRQKRMQISEGDGFVFHGPMESKMLRHEGARLCNRIGVILGIQVKEDIYGAGGGGSGLMRMG